MPEDARDVQAAPDPRPSPPVAPHATPAGEVAAALGADPVAGQTTADAAARRVAFGPNALREPPRDSVLARFVAQFRNALILVLVAAAVISAAIGEYTDAIVVGVVLLLNATIGTFQEARAERSVRALRGMLPPVARVRRDGEVRELDAAELVPGDVVLLEAGDRVPADGRVVRASVLLADESSLTGETTPATKAVDVEVAVDAPVADRATMLWMNTTVVRGRGELLVTATGMDTRIGEVAQLLADAPPRPTPLQRQIDALGRRLAVVAGVAVAAVFVVGLLRGDSLAAASMDAIALAIAAIPEGLPAVVTLTLALGTAAMARRNAIVKRLTSVETLGSTDVVCTDKTGTLTRNQMTVRVLWRAGRRHEVTGDGDTPAGELRPPLPGASRAFEAMILCNDAELRDGEVVGDPTEGALLVLAVKSGTDVAAVRSRPRLAEAPFDPTTKLMTTVHAGTDGELDVLVKGAPDVVVGRCTHLAGPDGPTPLDAAWRAHLDEEIGALAGQGLRTLAIATRRLDAEAGDLDAIADRAHGLTLEMIVGIVDPLRPGVVEAVARAHHAGIDVLMVTGDHPETARSIATELGIEGEVLTGADLDRLDQDELVARAPGLAVCARVAPEHKVRLVEALQAGGRTTAMTGDGVNDAAALQRADIGVAMGIAGTEVTKEAGDLVLVDDDFSTIVAAVERGRGIFDNILSFVRFQVTTNVGAIIAILGARLIGLPAPFTPIQVLWVNLIMDGPPALALGADPVRPDAMDRPPRDPEAPILSRARLRRVVLAGVVMATGTLAVFAWALQARPDDGGAFATTMAFTTFVLFQFINALNSRTEQMSVFSRHTLRNGKLWLALGVVLALQALAIHVPVVGGIVDVVPLGWRHWLLAAATACSLLVVEELRKLLARRLSARRVVDAGGPRGVSSGPDGHPGAGSDPR